PAVRFCVAGRYVSSTHRPAKEHLAAFPSGFCAETQKTLAGRVAPFILKALFPFPDTRQCKCLVNPAVSTCSSGRTVPGTCRHTGHGGFGFAWLRTSTSATCPGQPRRTTCTRCFSSTGRSHGHRSSPTGRRVGRGVLGSSRCPTRRRPRRPSPP